MILICEVGSSPLTLSGLISSIRKVFEKHHKSHNLFLFLSHPTMLGLYYLFHSNPIQAAGSTSRDVLLLKSVFGESPKQICRGSRTTNKYEKVLIVPAVNPLLFVCFFLNIFFGCWSDVLSKIFQSHVKKIRKILFAQKQPSIMVTGPQ